MTDLTEAPDITRLAVSRPGPHHLMVRRPGSDRLLIAFSGTGKTDGNFDFKVLARQMDCHVLLLNNGANAWYQSGVPGLGGSIESTAERLAACAVDLGAKDVATVGASMGGYAAVMFGCRVGARAIAFGCDTLLIDPWAFAARRMVAGTHLHAPDLRVELAERPVRARFYAGELDAKDLVAARRVRDLAEVITLRGVEHAAARYAWLTLGLKPLIDAFFAGTEMPRMPDEGSALKEPWIGDFLVAETAFEAGDIDSAARSATAMLDAHPDLGAALWVLGRVETQRERWDEAADHLSRLAQQAPYFSEAQFAAHRALWLAGRKPEALVCLEAACALEPKKAVWHARLEVLKAG